MYPGLVEALARQYGPAGLKHPGQASDQAAAPPRCRTWTSWRARARRFSNAWAQPFCSPTRASMLTGLSADKANVLNYTDPLAPSTPPSCSV